MAGTSPERLISVTETSLSASIHGSLAGRKRGVTEATARARTVAHTLDGLCVGNQL
jgi:hypothetical protein